MSLKQFLPTLFAVMLLTPLAHADRLCMKTVTKANGKTRLVTRSTSDDSCPKRFVEVIDTDTLRGDTGPQGAQGPAGDQGPSGSSSVICFAKFHGGSATIYNFGGEFTTSASVVRTTTGTYTLTCNGDFSDFEIDSLTILATSHTNNIMSTATVQTGAVEKEIAKYRNRSNSIM